MTVTLLPNTQLVAVAAIQEILDGANYVGRVLPEKDTSGSFSWQDTGFIQVTPLVGYRDQDTDFRHPIVSIDGWVVGRPGSNKVPWGKLNNLMEQVWTGAFKWLPHRIPLPWQFPDAQVFTMTSNTEPRVIPDLQSFGHMNGHLNIHWAPVEI